MGIFTKQKLSKNLLYYFGEIVVVVLGVLIAILLNNWNQNRKSKAEEKQSLERLYSDLATERYLILQNIVNFKKSKVFLDSVFYYRKTNGLDSIFGHMGNVLIDLGFSSEYTNLKSSGKLSLIQNNNLRSNLVRYYDGYQKRQIRYGKWHEDFVRNNVSPYFDANFDFQDSLGSPEPKQIVYNLKKREFRNLILTQISYLSTYQKSIFKIDQIDSLLVGINKQIQGKRSLRELDSLQNAYIKQQTKAAKPN